MCNQRQAALLIDLTANYSRRLLPADALLLANCVLTHIMGVEPFGAEGIQYKATHLHVVLTEAAALHAEARIGKAVSYLYAALIISIGIQTAELRSEPAMILARLAAELLIHIPSHYDLCGSSDESELIDALSSFALEYQQRNIAR